MSDIKTLDIRLLNQVFDMEQGYVLDFSDRTMGNFFLEELNIDIDEAKWSREGTSKAKRLRFFLKTVDNTTASRVITALWDYKKAIGLEDSTLSQNAEGQMIQLLARLNGTSKVQSGFAPEPAKDITKIQKLTSDLLSISTLSPHQRGYAFQTFLKDAFNLYSLSARESLRLKGEEIDGSFMLDNEIYLIEAKWTAEQTGVADLHNFEGKLQQRAAWTRGLFVSYSGFTVGGLEAFGRGKRTICMNGQDFAEALSRELPIDHVIRQKVRQAVETGAPFTPVNSF
jgi:hypothetical protein